MAVEVAEALPQLVWLAGLLVCLGLIFVVDGFTRALFGTVTGALGWIPVLGKVVTAPIEKIEQKIVHALGTAEDKLDSAIGASFHKLAAIIITTAELLIALPVLLYDVAAKLYDLALGNHVTHEVAKAATHAAASATATAEHGIDRLRSSEAAAVHGIDTLSGRVGVIEDEIAQTLTPELAALRERARAIEEGFQRAYELARKHEELLGLTAMTGAVAVALDELGGSWIRCETNKLLGRKLCGSNFGLVKALLEGALGAFTITELCNLSKLLVKVADSAPVQDVLTFVTHGLTDLFKCQGVRRPKPYNLAAVPLAPRQTYAALTPPSV